MRSSVVAKSRPARDGSGASIVLEFSLLIACMVEMRYRATSMTVVRAPHLHDVAHESRVAGFQPRVVFYKKRDSGACGSAKAFRD